MKKFPLKQIEKKQLRIILAGFFLALLIPTGFLVYQAYDQLKWEAYHQQRLLAEELSTRIDDQFSRLIYLEEQRAFSDYSFLNIAGDPSANILQRSPLTKLSDKSDIHGMIGYFQVDNRGQVSTPLLPTSTKQFRRFGISTVELDQRTRRQNNIINILSENRLISTKPAARPVLKTGLLSKPKPVSSEQAKQFSQPDKAEQVQQTIPAENKIGRRRPSQISSSTYSGFDELSRESDTQQAGKSSKNNKNRGLGKVDDIKLDTRYDLKRKKRQRQKNKLRSKSKSKQKRSAKRKEKTVLPEQRYQRFNIPTKEQHNLNPPLKLEIFESEIDPFEFSLLESGQFVLYRKVWRNERRYIQGILIDARTFLKNTVNPLFENTNLSEASDLAIAYNNNIYSVLKSANNSQYLSRAGPLQGTLLYKTRLTPPLNDIELIFSLQQLPASPGGTIITWTTLVLFIILCGGFVLVYRIGLRQIRLAQQQQDFVSSVSHELKTPLTSIRMYGEILRAGWADEKKKKSYYDYIYFESERLSRLIQNILQLARMTRNEFNLELNPVSVAELLDTIQSKVSSQLEQNQFELNLSCENINKDRQLNIDLDHFTQVIINLVDNGIKFAANADKKVIDINCHVQNNDRFVISIRDYGPGIAKDQLKKIFTLFYRTENELTRNTVGTGIGLSLVHQITLGMEGEIDVVNHQPGAEFNLTFPIMGAGQ